MKSFRQFIIEDFAPTAIAKERSTLPNLYRAHTSTEDFMGKGAISPDTGLHHFSVFHNGGKAIQPREIGTHVSSKTFGDNPNLEIDKRLKSSSRLMMQPPDAVLGLSTSFNVKEVDRHSIPDRPINSKLDISVHPDNMKHFDTHDEWRGWLESERKAHIKGNPKLNAYMDELNRKIKDHILKPSNVSQLGAIDNPPYVWGRIIDPPPTAAYKAAEKIDKAHLQARIGLEDLRRQHSLRIDSTVLKKGNVKAITIERGSGKNYGSGELMVLNPSIVDNTSHDTSPSWLEYVRGTPKDPSRASGATPDVTAPHVTAPHVPNVKVKGAGVVGLIAAPLIAASTALLDKKSLADAGGDALESVVNNLDPLITTTLGDSSSADRTPEQLQIDMDVANRQREKQAKDEAEKTKQTALNDTKSGNNSLNKTITDILSVGAKKNI